MDAQERQRRRTFDIISKFMADKSRVSLEMVENAIPSCNPKTGHITLPSNMKTENLMAALGLLAHEAGHIRFTKFDLSKAVRKDSDRHIINACEDARIDKQMMDLLPNMRGFYQEMYDSFAEKRKKKPSTAPIEVKILQALIKRNEGFMESVEPDVYKAISGHNLDQYFQEVIYKLYDLAGSDTKTHRQALWGAIDNFAKRLFKAKEEHEQEQQAKGQKGKCNGGNGGDGNTGQGSNSTKDAQGTGSGTGAGDKQEPDSEGDDTDSGSGDGDEGDVPQGNDSGDGGPGQSRKAVQVSGDGTFKERPKANTELNLDGMDEYEDEKRELLEADESVAYEPITENEQIALRETTKVCFTELLNIKETKVVPEGEVLDTDNLVAFPVGDIDAIYKDATHTKRMKSKVLLLLDCSGSMEEELYDKVSREQTVASTAKSIIHILEECNQAYGLDVTYDLRAFGNRYHILSKENWEREYFRIPDGGTSLETAFNASLEEMMKAWDVDGNKLILTITDGEVNQREIEEVRKKIIDNASTIKVMVVGVGACPVGHFTKLITRHNIITGEMADRTIMDAITEMLD